MNLTKNLTPPQKSCSLELQKMRKQKEKKPRCVEVWENFQIPQSLHVWFSEIRKRQHFISEYLAKNIQGKQDILHSYQNIHSFVFLQASWIYEITELQIISMESLEIHSLHFNCHNTWQVPAGDNTAQSAILAPRTFLSNVTDEQLDPSNPLE